MINDLREFLNLLEAKKDLVHISRPTSPRFEIAAGIRKTSDIEGPALLFDNVGRAFDAGSWRPLCGSTASDLGT